MKLTFSNTIPSSWKDLQDQVARFLNQAGYCAITPYTMDTARGKVEVDVLVDSPDIFVKKIVCECKFWDTPIPQEKVYAFRQVVADAGASLGLLISKNGFQSGAIETAKFSNVQLISWEEFLEIIKEKWILSRLKELKRLSAPISFYENPLDFPFEKLIEEDKKKFLRIEKKYAGLRVTCWYLTKSDLLNEIAPNSRWLNIFEFTSIEDYLEYLFQLTNNALNDYEEILHSSNINIPSSKLEKSDGYLYMFLN